MADTGTSMTRASGGQIFMETPAGRITFENQQVYDAAMAQMRGRGNGGGGGRGGGMGLDVESLVDAGQTVYAAYNAAEISELVKDAKRARKKLKKRQAAVIAAMKQSTSLPAGVTTELENVFKSQDAVDRSQTQALVAVVKAEVIQALGGGVKIVSKLADGGLLGDGAGTALAGGALGFGFASIFSSDDEDDDE